MADPVRIGLLTTANINRHQLAAQYDGAPYVFGAVASRELARAERYARNHGIPRARGSYEELLADPDLDAVYVALPNALHHEWTMASLRAGKHVLCEKPYSRIPEQVDSAFDFAEQEGLVLMEAFMWRHSRQTVLMMELLPALGELQVLHASFSFRLVGDADVRLDRALGGGSLLDVGCYCVSALRLLAGREPDLVEAAPVLGRRGIDESFAGLLRFGALLATC